MKTSLSKNSIFSGFFWNFGERILAQGVSFIVSVVLARILLPEDYGIVSMVLVFINIANVFVSEGFGQSLIQKKDATDTDFNTIFWCSLLFSLVIYAALYILAPFIADMYKQPTLTAVLRVFSLKLPLSSLNTIQHAYVSRNLQFKKFFYSTLGGTVVSGIIGIIMAYKGYGVWSIVVQYLLNSLIDTIVLLFTISWHPKFQFSADSANGLLGYSIKMTLSSLINTAYVEAQSLIIGAKYSSSELAYYKRGQQFPSLFINNVCIAINKVMFPTLSNEISNKEHMKYLMRESLQVTMFFISPVMFGLFAISEPLVEVVLTSKWLPCVPFLRLACLHYMLQPIQSSNCNAIKSLGCADTYLKMEVAKKVIGIALLIYSIPKGVFYIAVTCLISTVISTIISYLPNNRLLSYTVREQLSDIDKPIMSGLLMCMLIFPIQLLGIPKIWILCIQIAIGAIAYFFISYIFKSAVLIKIISSYRGGR